jgi:hypothetical protein
MRDLRHIVRASTRPSAAILKRTAFTNQKQSRSQKLYFFAWALRTRLMATFIRFASQVCPRKFVVNCLPDLYVGLTRIVRDRKPC